jgi:hypothetical protein
MIVGCETWDNATHSPSYFVGGEQEHRRTEVGSVDEFVNGEECVYESSGKSDELQTYLYDFPDPISKVGTQTEECTTDTHLSARL